MPSREEERRSLLGPSGWLIVHSQVKGGVSPTWTTVGQFDAFSCKLIDLGKSPLNQFECCVIFSFCSFKKWFYITKLDQEASEAVIVVLSVNLEKLQDVVLHASSLPSAGPLQSQHSTVRCLK